MKAAVKQYKNLILLVAVVILFLIMIVSDPLGFCAKRAHDRAAIYNQIAIEKAEADRQVAIIHAERDAQLERIGQGLSPLEIPMTEPAENGADTLPEETD